MHTRDDAPLTYAPPGPARRRLAPAVPTIGGTPFRPEPSLNDAQFDDILRVLRSMGRSMERMPGAFAALGEEDLRAQFLATLNAQFEGGASGEAFNYTGKTDLLVREGDRNVFIGECKIWQGPKTLTGGDGERGVVDQILDYLAWRDTRAAILLFVRRKDFSAVLAQLPELIERHPNHRRRIAQVSETEWRYRFAQRDDPARELTLAVLAFHLPQ